jgi:hypothetical protein
MLTPFSPDFMKKPPSFQFDAVQALALSAAAGDGLEADGGGWLARQPPRIDLRLPFFRTDLVDKMTLSHFGARMENAIQDSLVELGDQVRAAEIPNTSKQTALWCVDQLPTLYAKFRMTNESRYGDEISRLVQGALQELVSGQSANPATHELAASMRERLRLLHEQSGIPELNLKTPRPAPTRTRKAKSR